MSRNSCLSILIGVFIVFIGICVYGYFQVIDVVPDGMPKSVLLFNSVKGKILQYGYPGISRKISSLFPTGDFESHYFKQEVMSFTDNLYFHKDFDIDVNLYEPKDGINEETVVFLHFHGSGFCVNHPNTYQFLMIERLMKKHPNMIAVLPNYRKSPEFKRKSIFQDAEETLKYVIKKYGTDRQIILSGDSAGGAMAVHLSRFIRDGGYELYAKEKILLNLLYPWLCFLESQLPFIEGGSRCPVEYEKILWDKGTINKGTLYLFTKLSSDPEFDDEEKHNFFKNLSNLPDTMVFTGSFDVLGNEGKYFGELMIEENERNINIQIEGEVHGFVRNLDDSWNFVLGNLVEKLTSVLQE